MSEQYEATPPIDKEAEFAFEILLRIRNNITTGISATGIRILIDNELNNIYEGMRLEQ